MNVFPTTYSKREVNIAKKMFSLMKRYGLTFSKGDAVAAVNEILLCWDEHISDRFYAPSFDPKDYRAIGKLLQNEHDWVMDDEACMKMMAAHHVAIALVKK